MGSNRAKTKASKVNKHEVHKKKQQRTLIIMSSFLIAIMVLSTFGVMLYNDSGTDNTKDGFSFVQSSNEFFQVWNVSKSPRDKKEFVGTTFMYLPENGPEYVFNDGFNQTMELIMNSSFVYVITNPGVIDVDFISVFNETTNQTNIEMVEGSTFNETLPIYQYQSFAKADLMNVLNKVLIPLGGIERPFPGIQEDVITCNNATKEIPVISFTFNNETKEGINLVDNCVLINAENPASYIAYSDMLKYAIMVR